MAKLYADENFSFPIVVELRRLSHDVLTAQEAGQAQQRIPDAQVLAFAIAGGRAVLTHNRPHFVRLHRITSPHCGIIVCTRDDDAAAVAGRIDQAISALPSLDNQLIRVNLPATP